MSGPLFEDTCEDCGSYYDVNCRLTKVVPDSKTIETLYTFIQNLRKLPKPFRVTLDTTKTKMKFYMVFFVRLIKELNVVGVSECTNVDIIMYGDRLKLAKTLNAIIQEFSHYDHVTIRPIIVDRPKI